MNHYMRIALHYSKKASLEQNESRKGVFLSISDYMAIASACYIRKDSVGADYWTDAAVECLARSGIKVPSWMRD